MKKVCNDPVIYSTMLKNILPENFKEDITQMWNTQQPWKKYTIEYNQELLDYEPLAKDNSRLSCQIFLEKKHDGLTVKIPT